MDDIIRQNLEALLVTPEELRVLFEGCRRAESPKDRVVWSHAERCARLRRE